MNARITLAALLLLLLAGPALAGPTLAPLVIFTHTSDPSVGAGGGDMTTDFLGAGAEIKFGNFRAELALGRKAQNCAALKSCASSLGGYAALKWSPRK